MKKDLSVTILFGLLVVTIWFMLFAFDKQQQQIDNLMQPQHTAITKVEPVKVDAALMERLEELARENLIKDQIIKDYEAQIESFGWLKRAMDKEGVNP